VTGARARSRAAGAPARTRAGLVAAAVAAMLAGCVAGPDYVRPAVETPPAWKLEAPWREGTPDDAAPKGTWWQRFGDARLDALQAQALAQSPTLALANARLAQARAVVAATSAGLWPSVSLNARGVRQRISANRPLSNYASPNFSTVQNDGIVALSVNYEFDLAGRVQRTVEGASASAEQAAADFENTRLLLGTDLATAYFNLRAIDIELDVLARSIALQRRSLDFVRTRHDLGAASGLDVAQQQALLDTTLTQLDVLRRQRGPFEHAVATLTGTPAPSFSLVADIRELTPPAVPLGVPSDVLERRPDVASASGRWRLPTPRSASPRRRTTRASRSPPTWATRAGCWRACSARRVRSGRSARSSRSRSSRPAGSTPTSSSRAPTTTPPSPATAASS
jgi:NodT family efflux transporter outer membrane factor (OMF) lipoprotein